MRARRLLLIPLLMIPAFWGLTRHASSDSKPSPSKVEPHRSPIALALNAEGTRLLVANQTANSVSWVDVVEGKVLWEIPTGERPAGVALSRDGRIGVVSHWYGYDIAVLGFEGERASIIGRVEVGPEPRGVVVSADGSMGYVAVGAANAAVRVDLKNLKLAGRLEVGREPRGLALTPDGARLVVGNARSRELSVIDLASWKVENTLRIEGDNLRQVAVSPDGKRAYVANMRNRGMATTRSNIDQGWVLGQRLTEVAIDGSEMYSTLSLDPQGKAASDAHGAAIDKNGRYLAVSCGGSREVMIFRTDRTPLPWRSAGSRDLIAAELVKDVERFNRVETGGRPTELAFGPDGKTLYVANYLSDSVQIIDASTAKVTKSIALGGPRERSLVRRGEAIFHDATRSFNQWYSCNTCHPDGHTGGLDFDTLNDGWQDLSTAHLMSRKKVPTLRRVTKTGPWTWHGWQTDLNASMVESFTKSMQGPRPTDDDVKAIVAYLGALEFPRNPYRAPDGGLTPAASRGEKLFRSAKAGCSSCHSGPEFTDGKIHDVGLNEGRDVYKGHNPPSLIGVYDKDPYLHDGRARSLREVITGEHSPEAVAAGGLLNDREIDDLIEYLKSL